MVEIKSETAHAQSVASKFKGKSHYISITTVFDKNNKRDFYLNIKVPLFLSKYISKSKYHKGVFMI